MLLSTTILILLADVSLGAISDYDLESFAEMCRKNILASLNYTRRTDNQDLLGKSTSYNWGTYDYVIVGAGSAGTLLANRLSEDLGRTVLLLEAGGSETDFSNVPGMSSYLPSSDMNWGYQSVPQKYGCPNDEGSGQCTIASGKVLGGGSTINGKMYVRGNKADFDGWARMGNPGWSYEEVLPYFKKTENNTITGLNSSYHGSKGLLDVSYTDTTLFKDVYIDAMKELGYKEVDYNGEQQVGVGLTQFTLNRDRISSGGRSFIEPIIDKRPNLHVVLRAFVTKVIVDEQTKTAKGVTFFKNNKQYIAKARLEVIMSAGAYNTPQLLMLSGIGPAKHLREKGVKVVHELPAVGRNYQDHVLYESFFITTNRSLFNQSYKEYAKVYFQNRLRPWSTPYSIETVGFFPLRNRSSSAPDIQHVISLPPITDLAAELSPTSPLTFRQIRVQIILLKPKSKGSITLRSNDPKDFPNIDLNFFSDPENEDMETLVEAIYESLKLLDTKPFKDVGAQLNVTQVPECQNNYQYLSRDYFECSIRNLARSAYHATGTARMGNSTADSVVSADLRVHGLRRLRIVDASVFPEVTSGNTNAPTFMVAEKAADIIKRQYATV